MKYILAISFAIGLIGITASTALAALPWNHGGPAQASHMTALQPWLLTGFETEKVAIKLKPGEGSCPSWFPNTGCWDLSPIKDLGRKIQAWYLQKGWQPNVIIVNY